MSIIRSEPIDLGAVGRRLISLAVVAFALWPVSAAEATPPTLDSLTLSQGSILASWTVPAGMTSFSIEVARSPETYPDGDSKGAFPMQNWADVAFFFQAGVTTWLSRQLPGGEYHVHVSAVDSTTCPSPLALGCPKEWSETRVITVPPKPPVIDSVEQSGNRMTVVWVSRTFMASDFIEIATAPDVHQDGPLEGLFLDENLILFDDSLDPRQTRYSTPRLPGGTYYVHVGAYAPEACPTPDAPSCTGTISAIASVTIPAFPPRITYADQVDGYVALDWSLGISGDQVVEVATSPETYPGGALRGFFLDQNTVLYDILGFGDQTYDAADALPSGTYYAHIGARMSCLPPAYQVCLYEFSSPPAEIVVPGPEVSAPAAAADQPKPATALRRIPSFKSLQVAKRQSARSVAVRAVLEQRGTLTANGTVTLPGAARAYRFRTAFARAESGVPVTLRLRLSKKGLLAVRKAIRRRLSPVARITITARDAVGNRRVKTRTVRLKR